LFFQKGNLIKVSFKKPKQRKEKMKAYEEYMRLQRKEEFGEINDILLARR